MKQPTATLGRELDASKQQIMNFSLNKVHVETINRLYKTGFWGNTPAETFRRFVDRAFQQEGEK